MSAFDPRAAVLDELLDGLGRGRIDALKKQFAPQPPPAPEPIAPQAPTESEPDVSALESLLQSQSQ